MVHTADLFAIAKSENIKIEWRGFGGGLLGVYYSDPELTHPIVGLDPSLQQNERELRCVLAHELGHHFKTAGWQLQASSKPYCIVTSRSERAADDWALDILMEDAEFLDALGEGVSVERVAEVFKVTDRFVELKVCQLARKGKIAT